MAIRTVEDARRATARWNILSHLADGPAAQAWALLRTEQLTEAQEDIQEIRAIIQRVGEGKTTPEQAVFACLGNLFDFAVRMHIANAVQNAKGEAAEAEKFLKELEERRKE